MPMHRAVRPGPTTRAQNSRRLVTGRIKLIREFGFTLAVYQFGFAQGVPPFAVCWR
jgi:hypothetical protein